MCKDILPLLKCQSLYMWINNLPRDQPPIPKKRNPAQNKGSCGCGWDEGGCGTAGTETPSTILGARWWSGRCAVAEFRCDNYKFCLKKVLTSLYRVARIKLVSFGENFWRTARSAE